MAKIKTVSAAGKTVSAVGELRVLAERKGRQRKVEVRLLNSNVNRNDGKYLNLAEHAKFFAETPLLIAYKNGKIGDGHNFTEVVHEDGTVSASFMSATAERIVGYFKSENDIRIEIIDGTEWIVGTGYIWEWYAQELVSKLEAQGLQGMDVSIETLVLEMYNEGSTEVYTKYEILGTTILGDDVSPAVAGANIKALSALGTDAIKKMTIRVASINEGEENNPQKKNEVKGAKKTMQIKDIEAKFPNFTVLAVNGNTVALLSDKGIPHTCTVKKDAEDFKIGAKTEVCANAVFGEGEDAISVSVEDIAVKLNNEIERLNAELEAEKSAHNTVTAALEAMQKAENARRKKEVINAIKNHFAEVCANSGVEINANACDELLKDEAVASYAEMEDESGFCGSISACKDVDSICMASIISAGKARNNAANKGYAWDFAANGDNSGESFLETAIRKTIEK